MQDLKKENEEQARQIESLSSQIDSLGARGHWCGVKSIWSTIGTITYDRRSISDSNMDITRTPLDINTGINSQCYYYLDIDICHILGIFTVPVSGAWRLTYSMRSSVDSGEYNYCYLYLNGEQMPETRHETHSDNGWVRSTGGRVVTVEASAGDEIEIRTTRMEGHYYNFLYCAEYMTKM